MEDKLLQIIDHFGVDTQQRKLMEEVHELEQAITLHEAYLSNEYELPLGYLIGTKEHITEELGDVIVLLKQFIEYYKLETEDLEKVINKKVNRTIKRIENGYYEKKNV